MFADEIPEAVQWHEGMLLAPQHFQQSAARAELLLQYSALLLGPYCWGVRRLVLDTKLLPSGKFRVLDLEAVLPDGSVAAHHPRDDEELLLDLAPFADDMRQAPVSIHLTLPARSAGEVRGTLPRYRALEGDPVPDINTGEGEVRIPRLRPRLGLMAGPTPPPKYLSMPLAEVRFADEAFALTSYVPPSMSVPVHSPLGGMCSQVATRLRQKALYVSEQMRAPSVVLELPLLTEHRDHLRALVAELPHFEAILSTGLSHPLSIYLSLCSLAGQLTTLADGLLPPVFSAYNHSNPGASFQEVVGFITQMLDQGIPETYQAHPFRYKDRVYSLLFAAEWTRRRLVLGMRAAVGVTEKEMRQWGEDCLIGSTSMIPSLREKRILGAARQYVERDPELIAVRGVILFALEDVAEFIKPGDALEVLNFGERGASHRPLEMVLYVKGV